MRHSLTLLLVASAVAPCLTGGDSLPGAHAAQRVFHGERNSDDAVGSHRAAAMAAAHTLAAPVPAPSDVSAQGACVVRLVSPEPDATLPQRRLEGDRVRARWRFSWTGCPRATRYHLFVIGPSALNPIVNLDTLETTSHVHASTYHRGVTNRFGWTWRVRALVDGRWGEWSDSRTFNVATPTEGSRPGEAPPTCSITGQVAGELRFDMKDDRGQPLTFTFTEMLLRGPDGAVLRRARVQNRRYTFAGLPAGAVYTVFPGNFRSTPRERSVRCAPRGIRNGQDFRITGPPPHE